MKQPRTKLLGIILCLCLLLTPILLTSCASYETLRELYGFLDNGVSNVFGDDTESKPSDTGNSEPTQPPIQNTIVIEGGDGGNISYAAASGLRSIVSIYATYQSNSLWGSTSSAAGSGVIYRLEESGSAFVVTNHHVVYNSSTNAISNNISLFLYGMENQAYAIPATYVGGSANYDLAVLRVDNSEVLKSAMANGSVVAATISNSDLVIPGQTAIAIGNPEASGISVTTGIVSVDSEYISMTATDGSGDVEFRVIRIDTAVNSGNSGGGLFNGQGELIGIVNAKIISSDVENIGYAIPSNVARAIADNIIDYCYGKNCKTVMRGLLGITVTTASLSTSYDTETGLFTRIEEISVYEVSSGGLGESILQPGDIIQSITVGEKAIAVTRQYHLIDAMLDVRVGDRVSLSILRNGKEMTVSTTITEACLAAY